MRKKILAIICFSLLAMSFTGCSFQQGVKVEVNGETVFQEGDTDILDESSAPARAEVNNT